MFNALSRGLTQVARAARPLAAPQRTFVQSFVTKPTVAPTKLAAPAVSNAMAQDARAISTLSMKFRPYALSSAPVSGIAPLSAGYTAVGLTLFAAPQQVLLTTAGVLGCLAMANLVHGAVNRGAAFQHNWLMIFFQMVLTFMPVPCFENLVHGAVNRGAAF